MPRTELDRRLNALRAAVIDMGDAVEASIGQAADALCRRDHALAHAVIAADDGIDQQCATGLGRMTHDRCGKLYLSGSRPDVRDYPIDERIYEGIEAPEL